MAGINRHLVVLGCGLLATAVLAYSGGLATAAWLATPPARCELPSPAAREDGDAGRAAGEPAGGGGTTAGAGDDGPGGEQTAPVPGPRAAAEKARFHVQVGSFIDRQAAGAIAVHLAERGYPASVETRADRTGAVWYAPVVGAYGDHGIAVEAAREVARRAGMDAHVVALAPGGDL